MQGRREIGAGIEGDLDQEIQEPGAYRVVLSSRMLGRVYHAEGVERKIRNSVLGRHVPRP